MHDQDEKCEGISSYLNFDWLTERQTVDQDQHHVIHVPPVMTGSTYLSKEPRQVIDLTNDTTEVEIDLINDTTDVEFKCEMDLTIDTTYMEIDLTNDTTDVEFKCDDLSCFLDYSWLQGKTSQRKMVKETSKSLVEETSKTLVEETSKTLLDETSKSLVKKTSKSLVEETSKTLVEETSKTLVKETSKTLVEETSKTLVEETSKTLAEETSNIVSIDAIYEQGHSSHPFSNSNKKEFENSNILPDQTCYSACDNTHPSCPFQIDIFNLEGGDMLSGSSDDVFCYPDINKAATKCTTTEYSPAHSCNMFGSDSTVNDSTVLSHHNITDNTNNHTELDIPCHMQKMNESSMAVFEGECGVQEELVDIGDIVYQHGSYNNTTISSQHSEKVEKWEEKYSTLHVLPTISTDVCVNIESQDNGNEIIDSNVTELVHGNVYFEKQRSKAGNSHRGVINEHINFDGITTTFEEKLDSSRSSLQIPDADLDNTIDSTTNEHQYEYKLSEDGDHIMGKNINLMSKENASRQTTLILNESLWQNKLTFNEEKVIIVGDTLKPAQSDKIVNIDHKFGKFLTKSLTKSSDFSSHLMNQKGRWRIILDRLKTSSHNSQFLKQNVSVYDLKKPERHCECDLVDLERNDTRDRLINKEYPRNDVDKDDIDECYNNNFDEKDG